MDLLGISSAVHDNGGLALVGREGVYGLAAAKIPESCQFRLGEVRLYRPDVTKCVVDLDAGVICRGLVTLRIAASMA